MNPIKTLAALSAATMLSACASILSGTEQKLTVHSNPEGANCALARPVENDGAAIQFARVNPAPDDVTITKTKHDITVSCSKPGYVDGVALVESDTDATVFGNLILGGLVGWGIDSARGADNKYNSDVHVSLISKNPQGTAPAVAPVVSAPLASPAPVAPAPAIPPAAPVVQTKYPKVAPEPEMAEQQVTGYIAPVPWYKGPAPKPRTLAPEATPATPQEVPDAAPFKKAK